MNKKIFQIPRLLCFKPKCFSRTKIDISTYGTVLESGKASKVTAGGGGITLEGRLYWMK